MMKNDGLDSDRRLKSMLYWDVNNGIACRAWARKPNAVWSIEQEIAHTTAEGDPAERGGGWVGRRCDRLNST
ncbi:MAG: hypothetical protein JNL52_01520 [Flavobacteriales bacterium]|nr:hypothetical protein [Flavobacteriales bacterium]